MSSGGSGGQAGSNVGASGSGVSGMVGVAGAIAAGSGGAGTAGSSTAGTTGTAGTAVPTTDAGTPDAGGSGAPSEHTPVASAGCGKSGRPNGGVVTVAGSHIYSFPASYDGTKPLPLIMAFHAAGNSNDQLRNITKASPLAEHFVMAFPKSQGNGWNLGTDSARIDARYDDLVQNHCIDTSRVFATGHSSGAQLIVQLLCRGDERFAAVAPVASSAYCASWADAIPALIIHGANDRERANTNQDADGRKDLAPYLKSNGCGMDALPNGQAGCASGGTQVAPGCVAYRGCTEPTVWCHHDDPQYSNTNHGWPCFANDAIDAFFSGLP